MVAGRYGPDGGHPGLVYRDRPLTYAEVFTGIDRWHQRTFLVQGEHRFTFGEFFAAVDSARNRLQSAGIQPRDRIMILAYNRPDWVLALIAIW